VINPKKAVVFGATGTIGSAISKELKHKGYYVTVVTRNPQKARSTLSGMDEYVLLDFNAPKDLIRSLENAEAVINLSGEPLLGNPFSKTRKELVYSSRVTVTKNIVSLLSTLNCKPKVFINASAIGFYGFHEITNVSQTEESNCSLEYQGTLTKDWEEAAIQAERFGIRVIVIRTGLVLDLAKNGALKKLALPFYWFVGGYVGIAKSWRSWIHLDDEIGIIMHTLSNTAVFGPVNATAPNPVTNREFANALGKALRRPALIPVPEYCVKLLLKDITEVITRGKKVLPVKAISTGYKFKFETISEALSDLL
jgi:uncharacterized protein (TIGR01777 family)